MQTVKRRELKHFGHVVRDGGLARMVLEGEDEGHIRRGGGGPKNKWLDNVIDRIGPWAVTNGDAE